jgi:hypothetical protein
MHRAATALLVALLPAGPAFAKSAFYEIQERCPCEGPSARVFWTDVADRLACVDAVLADLREQGWPAEVLAHDRVREQRTRCGDPARQCDGTPARPCPRGTICDIADANCRPEGATGTCVSKKRAARRCRNDPYPVCGCDGRTYRTHCGARKAGVAVAFGLRCDVLCGGPDRIPCGPGQYCHSMLRCDGADAFGACLPNGEPCDAGLPSLPVCGCDGTTYASTCELIAAGVPRRHYGSCEGGP